MGDVEIQRLTDDDMEKELKEFEVRFGMSSAEFYEKYNRGEMGDSAEVMEWAGLYEVKLIKQRTRTSA